MTSSIRPRARLAATFFAPHSHFPAARAQNAAPRDTSIDAQLFQPAIGPQNFLTVEGAQVPDHKRLSFGLALNYQQRPYSAFTQGIAREHHIIDNQFTGELDAAIGLFTRYQVGIGLPFTPYLDGDEVDAMGLPAHLHCGKAASATSASRARRTSHLGPDDQYDVAISAGLTLPTGHTAGLDWLGDRTVTGRIRGDRHRRLGPVTGRQPGHPDPRHLAQLRDRDGAPAALRVAANYAVNAKTGVILEAFGRSGLSQFISFYSDVNPFEIDLAGRRSLNGMWSLTGGIGAGWGTASARRTSAAS